MELMASLASHLINISSDNEHTTLQNNSIMKTNKKNKMLESFKIGTQGNISTCQLANIVSTVRALSRAV